MTPWHLFNDMNGMATSDAIMSTWFRFLNPAPGERIELVLFGKHGGPSLVAFASSLKSAIRLADEQSHNHFATGIYCVPNVVSTAFTSRRAADRWLTPKGNLATDADIAFRRVIYFDVDSVRPKDTNATDEEKRCARELACVVERSLYRWVDSEGLDTGCIGGGSSGNGSSLFLAIEPVASTPRVTAAIAELLKHFGQQYQGHGAALDTCVSNPNRLVPLFGTMKRKGPDTEERPHRLTGFACRLDPKTGTVPRIPIEAVLPSLHQEELLWQA